MPKIMLVEDEYTTRLALEAMLISMGYDVIGMADSGEQAVVMTRDLKPDLILMDIVMPGHMDGISAAAKIRSEQDVAIIFLTGHANPEYIERAKKVEPFGYIMKPWTEEDIRASVEIALYKNEMRRKMRESMAELKREKSLTQQYLDLVGVMIIVLNEKGDIVQINKKGCEILKCSEKEISGKNWFENCLPNNVVGESRKIFKKLLSAQTEGVEYVEARIIAKDGEERLIAWHNTALQNGAGEIIGMLSAGEDITDRRRMEEKLKEAQKMEAVGVLVKGIAHQFNNILGIILGKAELALYDMSYSNSSKRPLKEICSATLKASELVEQMIYFAGSGTTNLKPIEVVSTTRESLKEIRASIPAMIEIGTNLLSEPQKILADSTGFRRILMILCSNAAYAMKKRGGGIGDNPPE